jgi:hypothetical protein
VGHHDDSGGCRWSQADGASDDRLDQGRPRRSGALEAILYGTAGTTSRLPLPDEVIALVGTGETNVDLTVAANQPTFVAATGVITLPAVAGVQWRVNGANRAAGAQPALASG